MNNEFAPTPPPAEKRRRRETRIGQLETKQTNRALGFADKHPDVLQCAIEAIETRLAPLRSQLDELNRAQDTASHIDPERMRQLAAIARQRLSEPTPQLEAELYRVLSLQLHRLTDDQFEGTATILIPSQGTNFEDLLPTGPTGEVRTKAPRHPTLTTYNPVPPVRRFGIADGPA